MEDPHTASKFLKQVLTLNPESTVPSYNFVNSANAREFYPDTQSYINTLEPLLFDEALSEIQQADPMNPQGKHLHYTELEAHRVLQADPNGITLQGLEFFVTDCPWQKWDLLLLQYHGITPENPLFAVVWRVKPNPKNLKHQFLQILVHNNPSQELVNGFFSVVLQEINNVRFSLWKVSNLVSVWREYQALFDIQASTDLLNCILDPRIDGRTNKCIHTKNEILLEKAKSIPNDFFGHAKHFNASQKNAIIASACLNPLCRISLIQGPPGTGKTETITGIVAYHKYLMKRLSLPWRILICSPSNVAINNVCEQLCLRLFNKAITDYENRVQQDPSLVAPKLLARLGRATGLKPELSRFLEDKIPKAGIVCCTLSSSAVAALMDPTNEPFSLLVIDEAGQATELSTLIPFVQLKRNGVCVLVGDHKQLPATVISQVSQSRGYSVSLFERAQRGRPDTVHLLTEQHRMHPEISHFPNIHFYEGKLANAASVSEGPYIAQPYHSFYYRGQNSPLPQNPTSWKKHIPVLGPYIFYNVQTDKTERSGKSLKNTAEVALIKEILTQLFASATMENGQPFVTPSSVGIISFYKGQVKELLTLPWDIETNTVDGFQGRQMDIIILSCVRSGAGSSIGFLTDPRRVNVAITRAKYSLIIVGDANKLQSFSSNWRALIKDAKHRGCYADWVPETGIQGVIAQAMKEREPPVAEEEMEVDLDIIDEDQLQFDWADSPYILEQEGSVVGEDLQLPTAAEGVSTTSFPKRSGVAALPLHVEWIPYNDKENLITEAFSDMEDASDEENVHSEELGF